MTENNDTPLVSVLMTVYNREKYIGDAIKSVIASTYKNFELIIVDDRSKDESMHIAHNYAEKDNRIRIYVNEKNLGDYPNRNKAASYAKGKYLKYVDADDMIYPYGLEQLVYYMENFPDAGYGLCSLDQDKNRIYPFLLSPQEAYQCNYFYKSLFHKAPLSGIIKKNVFDKLGGFSGKQHVGDFELWHIISQKYPVVLMPQGIVWYREHDDQQMNDNRTDPYVPFKYLMLAKELLQAEDCPLEKEEKRKALQVLNKNISKSVISAAKNNSFKKGMELKEASKLSLGQITRRLI